MKVDGILCHDTVATKTKQKLAFDNTKEYASHCKAVREKFIELLGVEAIKENACELHYEIEKEVEKDGYKQIRITFESECGSVVPCYLLIPNTGKEKYPVVITLQGHTSGAHNSIAEPYIEHQVEYAKGRGAFGVQAVREGYIALVIEQRGMGERRAMNLHNRRVSFEPENASCYWEATTALMLGRTLIGERCWDISRAIDLLAEFPQCDTDKIVITGHSGGGTAAYYAACYDERIKICVPSCAFCTYEESILRFAHCSCNYIPNIYRWFDMQDLACLIAPRRLAIIAGTYDTGFLVEGVTRGYKTVESIFESAGCKENCRLEITQEGHWWCVDTVWPIIKDELRKIN